MPYPRSRAHYMSMLPAKQGLSRAGLTFLVVGGVVLLAISKAGGPAAERLRMGVADIVSPVLSVASKPIDAVAHVGQFVSEMATLRSENIALKNQNVQLKLWQLKAQEMESETQALRKLLKVVPPRIASYVTAPVVSDLGGPYVHSALIGGGNENGIGKDRAVINENGLVGRVVEVGERSARVLLLTDINSRVPVMVENAGGKTTEKSILMGGNSDLPTLAYLAADSHIAAGDRIVTSGDGGVFPKGIAVGKVASIEGGIVKVQPFVDSAKLDYVTVVDSPIK